MNLQYKYLRSTLYKDLVSSPLHFWLFLYLFSLAFTNVRLYGRITISELVFIPVIPFLLLIPAFRTWFKSRQWNIVLSKVILVYIAVVFSATFFAICDESLVTAISSLYFYLLFLTGFLIIQQDINRSVRVLIAGLSLASCISVLVSIVGMIWSVQHQQNSLTAWYFQDYPYFGDMARAMGFMSTPTMMALLSGSSLLLKLPFYLSNKWNKLLGLLLLMDIAGLLMTSSKVILAVFAGAIIILFFKKYLSRSMTYSSITALTIILVFSTHFLVYKQGPEKIINPIVTGVLIFQWQGYDIYTSCYLEFKKGSLKAIDELFPFGTGPGCHLQYIENLIFNGAFHKAIGSGNPHSVYTGIVAELGLLGLIFLSLLVLSVIFYLRKIITLNQADHQNIAYFLAAFFIFFGIEAICSDLLSQRQFWLFLGVLAGLSHQGRH